MGAMSTTAQPPKPKRRWCRFSLKTLMIVVTVATVAFGIWVQYRRQRAMENRERVAAVRDTVAAIEELGGTVDRAYEELRPRTWLEEQFDDPGDANDPVGLLTIWSVNLNVSNLTDDDMEHLKGMSELDTLYVGPYIGNTVDVTHVTDAGLVHLKGLTKLETLYLNGTSITDAGLVQLKGLTKLKDLNLRFTYVTESGLKHLKGLTELETLWLGGFGGCEVTDAGLEHLKGLTKLKDLRLYNSKVTDEGVKRLQQALPNCTIHRFVIVG